MIKVVYILISSEKDYYAEQALISIFSLKKHNPDSEIVLLSDRETYEGLTGNRARIKEYVDKFIQVKFNQGYKPIQRSRILKTRLPEYISGDYLYLDNDTIITGSLDELNNFECDVAAVYNQHREDWKEIGIHPHIKLYHHLTGKQYDIDFLIKYYYNGGVILVRDTVKAKDFFKTWNDLWFQSSTKFGFHKDQPDMWRANYMNENVIKALDDKYNVQAIYPKRSWIFRYDCRIFHYFTGSKNRRIKCIFKQEDFLQSVRTNGFTDRTKSLLANVTDELYEDVKLKVTTNPQSIKSPFIRLCKPNKLLRQSGGIIRRLALITNFHGK